MQTPVEDKRVATACAMAALEGILVTLSQDDHGQRTLILSRGAWTRETAVEGVAAAIAEARELVPC